MTVVNLVNEPQGVITGNDNIVIVNYFDGIRGGRSLDLTGYTEKFVKAGHILIETSDGKIQPLPVSEEAYTPLGNESASKYCGVLVATIPASKPFAAIMTRGTINPKAAPYTLLFQADKCQMARSQIDRQCAAHQDVKCVKHHSKPECCKLQLIVFKPLQRQVLKIQSLIVNRNCL